MQPIGLMMGSVAASVCRALPVGPATVVSALTPISQHKEQAEMGDARAPSMGLGEKQAFWLTLRPLHARPAGGTGSPAPASITF